MNRLTSRLRAFAVVGLLAVGASLLSGCGTGQISQTAMQEPAVNGNRLTITNTDRHYSVDLRDIRIQAAQSGDFINPPQTVELLLVVVNQSPYIADRLTEIKTDIGTVAITGDPRLQPGGMLFVGNGQRVAPGARESVNAAKAVITLSKPISNGLLYDFTFKFESVGEGTVKVPITAGEPASHV